MEKKLVKHGNSLALVIDKPLLNLLGITDKTKLVLSVEDNRLVIKPNTLKKTKSRNNDIDAIAQEIMKKYAPVFKRLAKS